MTGRRSSPHGCIQMELLSDEVAKGCFVSPGNPFLFVTICMNLPGMDRYDPSLPWVSNGRITGDVKTYVDDKHPSGQSEKHC
jgi:hypothetical protein